MQVLSHSNIGIEAEMLILLHSFWYDSLNLLDLSRLAWACEDQDTLVQPHGLDQ